MSHPKLKTNSATYRRTGHIASLALLTALSLSSRPSNAETDNIQSLCYAPEETVFACTVEPSKKIVSLCAAPISTDPRRFYYAYGRPSSIELKYPSDDAQADAFSRTHLSFAGNTGGYAYAFKNGAYKYILYSISGARGYERSGVIVQRDGSTRALRDMRCEAATVVETENDLTLKATYQWRHDPDIESAGLPGVR